MSQTLLWYNNYNVKNDIGSHPKLNEYIDKLDNDKTLSKIIIDKTYRLISE